MKTLFYSLFLMFFLLLPKIGQSQHLHTTSKKALKNFNSAIEYFDMRNDDEALMYLKKAINADSRFLEAYMMLAQIYRDKGEHDLAIRNYRKGLSIDPGFNPGGHLVLADYLFQLGHYEEAVTEAEKFEKAGKFVHISEEELSEIKEKYEFALHLKSNPVPFNPVNLGDSINSDLNEYWPSLSVDEQTLVFTVALNAPDKHPDPRFNFQEDFYFSKKNEDGSWSTRKNLGPPVNTEENEGAQTITATGNKLYYTHCRAEINKGNCNIYYSVLNKGRWSAPRSVGSPVNTQHREKQPSVSSDDRILFFSSDRPGGIGGMDIWISYKNQSGEWSEPLNPGKKINTPGDEQSPFIHPDGMTLYFSSDGHKGLGNADIFYSRLNDDDTWSEAVNMGYPVNTNNVEFSLIVNSLGNKAYFASNREQNKGTDIYEFDLYEEARPISVSYMKGRVYDAKTYKGLAANFQLIDLKTSKVVVELMSDSGEGSYLIPLPVNRDYALNVSHPGYLFYSENFSFSGIHEITDPFQKNVALNPIQTGEKIILRNIFFDFDEWEIKNESVVELEKMALFLKQNSSLKVEISGHTDNIGTDAYNKTLSQRRAEAVILYLIDNGIDAHRLVSKGYGDDEPLAANDTEEGRAQNRRTEMKIIR